MTASMSDFSSLCQEQCVFDVDTQIPHRILDLGMPEQNLDGAQVGRAPRPRETGVQDRQRERTCRDTRAVAYARRERHWVGGDEDLVNFDVGMRLYKSGLAVGSGLYGRADGRLGRQNYRKRAVLEVH